MLQDHGHFPVSVLKELAEQRQQRSARCIGRAYRRALPDGTTGAPDPKIEFVVLIANQLFIKAAQTYEVLAPPRSQIHGVSGPGIVETARRSAARPESTLK